LENLSFDVTEGEFVTIVGPSGCGKSTLLLMVAGLIPPSEGEIFFDGKLVRGPQKNIGFVFQTPVLLKWRRVIDNVLLPIEILRLNREDFGKKGLELLKICGLEGFEDRYPDELSGGMQQRVSICRALIYDPSLLLMDEPFGALDAMTRDEMNFELQRIWLETKKTILFVTHSIDEAVFLGDRVIVMTPRPGRIAKILKVNLPRPRTAKTKSSSEFAELTAEIRQLIGLRE
jgi:NitT/TauT family transport system ATP-binding protein